MRKFNPVLPKGNRNYVLLKTPVLVKSCFECSGFGI